jgi:hypothetical protein
MHLQVCFLLKKRATKSRQTGRKIFINDFNAVMKSVLFFGVDVFSNSALAQA